MICRINYSLELILRQTDQSIIQMPTPYATQYAQFLNLRGSSPLSASDKLQKDSSHRRLSEKLSAPQDLESDTTSASLLYENSSVGSAAAAEPDSGSHLQLLVYETEPLKTSSTAQHVHRTMEMSGIDITVIGQDTNFQGFGSKYSGAITGVYNQFCIFVI